MTIKTILTAALCGGVLFGATTAAADPKPRPSKPATGQAVAQLFAGKTHVWKDNKGGLYYGAKGEVIAYSSKHKDAVGVGTWTVRKGKLCHKLTWYAPKDGAVVSKEKDMKCEFQIVTDKDGQYWHSWESDKDFWRGPPKDDNFAKGFKFKNKANRNRKKLGV